LCDVVASFRCTTRSAVASRSFLETSIVSYLTRSIVVALASLVLLVSAAQPAFAKQDWLGWLEEFSGPGPFEGFELSVEFACLNVSHRDAVSRTALIKEFPQVTSAAMTARSSWERLARALDNAPGKNSGDFARMSKERTLTAANIERLLSDVQAEIDAMGNATQEMRTSSAAARSDLNVFRSVTREALRNARSVAKRQTKTVGGRSCWGASDTLDEDRRVERRATARNIDEMVLPGGSASDVDLYEERRDWQTGFVINVGGFWSEENRLFDPAGTRTGNDEEPQLRVVPLEFLVHHKLSPAIDMGAGLGVAFFHTDFRNNPWRPTKNAAFYLVPLSVVVRPAKLFTNQRWAAALGYRVNLRYFGDLEGKDFGRPEDDLLPGEKYFRQNGEFVWGAAAFFDLFSILGR
jgi:hypothetical protein